MATIVEAVTRAINSGNDENWAVDFNHMNNWGRKEFILYELSSADWSDLADYSMMERLHKNPGSAKLWADWMPLRSYV